MTLATKELPSPDTGQVHACQLVFRFNFRTVISLEERQRSWAAGLQR
ncbi:hypothetical protein SBRY_21114 [Actinacidiphila bryophytorum]|uniref:Uncharacterized protein n=1 Tax=Actinacidiphila bryophytorum TaxID=1436133 RepID=A0A9W4EAH9_9ACTN|nr:hypothetical protein SBRY_21114 [Actinacidiphila bryophytorum]